MKRLVIALTLVAALAGSNAFASRARNVVWGTGDGGLGLLGAGGAEGSFYVGDAYNMFYNPVYINDFGNWVAIERSNGAAAAGTNTASGGMVNTLGPIKIGAFFNRQTEVTGFTGQSSMTPIDLIVGGDMGIKWGLGLNWAAYNGGVAGVSNGSALNLNLGAAVAGFEPWFQFRVLNREYADATTFNARAKIGAGLNYKFGEWTPYFAWNNTGTDTSAATGVHTNTFFLGLGRNTTITESARLNYHVGAGYQTTPDSTQRIVVPVGISAEVDATSWMALRAGFGVNLYDRNRNVTVASNGTGRIGATFKLGKLDLDWTVGGGGTTGSDTDVSRIDDDAFGISGSFFSLIGATYRM